MMVMKEFEKNIQALMGEDDEEEFRLRTARENYKRMAEDDRSTRGREERSD